MLHILHRFAKYLAVIFFGLSIASLTYAEDRAEDISILDIDADGDVDALTDGLLLLRSMFGFEVGALTTEATSPEFTECDATCTLRSLSN